MKLTGIVKKLASDFNTEFQLLQIRWVVDCGDAIVLSIKIYKGVWQIGYERKGN